MTDDGANLNGDQIGIIAEVDYRAGIHLCFYEDRPGAECRDIFNATLNEAGAEAIIAACQDYLAFWKRIEQEGVRRS